MIGIELECHIFDYISGHVAEALLTLRTILVKELIIIYYYQPRQRQKKGGEEIIITMGKTQADISAVYDNQKVLQSTVFEQLMLNMGWAKVHIMRTGLYGSSTWLQTYCVGLTPHSPVLVPSK